MAPEAVLSWQKRRFACSVAFVVSGVVELA
jgi:hypothetical protein